MATAAQIAANRDNAQKSTGPRSVEGKFASSMNAFKHGLDAASPVIPGEDPAEYERIAASYNRDLRPRSALEQLQVDIIIRADWQRRRLVRIEANLYRALLDEGQTPDAIDPAVLRDSPTGKLLLRVFAQIASLEHACTRALSQLRRLRRERDGAAAEALDRFIALPPEAPAIFAAAHARIQQANEPNPDPQPAPESPFANLALRL